MSETFYVEQREQLKEKPDFQKLAFGEIFTDYMLSMSYKQGEGWSEPKIIPYGPITLSPSAQGLHYGQTVFEGMKAYKDGDEVTLFRPDQNFKRINLSLKRLEMPQIDEDKVLEGLLQLIDIERDWVPNGEGQSLYVRPFVYATEPYLGVRSSTDYEFLVILSPVGAYYGDEQLKPTSIYVEDEFVRAVRGGVGFAKCGGNYAASLIAQTRANELGFDQVLWLDGVEQKYIEEVGSMNIFFVIDGKVVTPELNGSILPGITRKTVLELAQELGYETEEKRISIDEVVNAHHDSRLTEIFGTGTAAVISPVGFLKYDEVEITINDNKTGPITNHLFDEYTAIQTGKKEDKHGWRVVVGQESRIETV